MRILKVFVCLALIVTMLLPSLADATNRVAVLKEVKGSVYVKKSGGKKEFKGSNGMSLTQGDSVRTEKESSAKIVYENGTKSTIGANSKITITKLKTEKNADESKVKVWSGKLWNSVKNLSNTNDSYDVETPTAVMGVRGTHFLVTTDPKTGKTSVTVLEGTVAVSDSDSEEVLVTLNETMDIDNATEPKILDVEQLIKAVDIEILVDVIDDLTNAAMENSDDSVDQKNLYMETKEQSHMKESIKLAKIATSVTDVQQKILNVIKFSDKRQQFEAALKETKNKTLNELENEANKVKQEVGKIEHEVIKEGKNAGITDEEIKKLTPKSAPLNMQTQPSTSGGTSASPSPTPTNNLGIDAVTAKQTFGSTRKVDIQITDANHASNNINHYKVFVNVGSEPGNNPAVDKFYQVDVANAGSFTMDLTNLTVDTTTNHTAFPTVNGERLYITVVAYDTSGNKSAPATADKTYVVWDLVAPSWPIDDTFFNIVPETSAGINNGKIKAVKNIEIGEPAKLEYYVTTQGGSIPLDATTESGAIEITDSKIVANAIFDVNTSLQDAQNNDVYLRIADVYGNKSEWKRIDDDEDTPDAIDSASFTQQSFTKALVNITDTNAAINSIDHYKVFVGLDYHNGTSIDSDSYAILPVASLGNYVSIDLGSLENGAQTPTPGQHVNFTTVAYDKYGQTYINSTNSFMWNIYWLDTVTNSTVSKNTFSITPESAINAADGKISIVHPIEVGTDVYLDYKVLFEYDPEPTDSTPPTTSKFYGNKPGPEIPAENFFSALKGNGVTNTFSGNTNNVYFRVRDANGNQTAWLQIDERTDYYPPVWNANDNSFTVTGESSPGNNDGKIIAAEEIEIGEQVIFEYYVTTQLGAPPVETRTSSGYEVISAPMIANGKVFDLTVPLKGPQDNDVYVRLVDTSGNKTEWIRIDDAEDIPNNVTSVTVTQNTGSQTLATINLIDLDAIKDSVDHYKVFIGVNSTSSAPGWDSYVTFTISDLGQDKIIDLTNLTNGPKDPQNGDTVNFIVVAYDKWGSVSSAHITPVTWVE